MSEHTANLSIDVAATASGHRLLAIGARARRFPRLMLVALGALLFLPGLGNHDLWNPDEPRYAEVTREMIASGDYLVPYLNGEVYTHKPPLMFWLMAVASLLVGDLNETATRLPSALSAIACLLLVYALGRRLFDERSALVAALAFATMAKVLWQARTGQIDMLLAALVALTAYFWVRAYLEQRPHLYLVGFGVAGLGTLAKGPVALLPLLLSFLAFLLLERNRREIGRMRIGWGLLLWAGIVLAWLGSASLAAGGAYLEELVVTQNLTRYAAGADYYGTRGHLQPWYHYLVKVPAELLPWSLLLPAAGVAFWRARGRETDPRFRHSAKLLACWAIGTLIFFSLSPAKRSVYALQMYPAAALLVGGGLVLFERSMVFSRRWLVVPIATLALTGGGLSLAIALLGPTRPEAALVDDRVPYALAAAAGVIAIGAVAAAWQANRGRTLAMTAFLAAGLGCGVSIATFVVLPTLDAVKSVRPMTQLYLELSRPDEPYAFYPGQEAALQFYTERTGTELNTEDELHAFLRRPGPVWLFVERDALERLGQPPAAREVGRSSDPDNGHVLLVTPNRERPVSSE